MRHCLSSKNRGLHYRSDFKLTKEGWVVVVWLDSDWAQWKGSRRSRTGYLIFLNGNLIAYGSVLQSSVALSSTEAEYMALSYVTRMLLWILNIINAIPGQFVVTPIKVHMDNKPAINLANNHAASKYT